MKKIIVAFIVGLFSFIIIDNIQANGVSPDEAELSFAKKYFAVLYVYDVKAASFAEDSQMIQTQERLINLFELQKEHVDVVINQLGYLKPVERYIPSYNKVIKGLHEQDQYLTNLLHDMETGLSFDEAFTVNSWTFIQAQKNIQDGVAELKEVIESYSNVYQMKVVAATGITEKQLIQNASNCEYYRQVQEYIK